ncbi:MAG: hypothetical protein J7M25_12820 [Deltaproteobacteria bacterium]|nr:hypothetical protein [Deltaproteobacteria bacterium]
MSMLSLSLAFALSIVQGPLVAATKAPNLHGTWTYQTSGHWHKGVCPGGGPRSGRLTIQRRGHRFTLVFVSGSVCRPASMCRFAGTVHGRVWKASNHAKVDNEGGAVKNTLVLHAKSAKRATGISTSTYTHPGGMRCTWGYRVTLRR